MKKIFCLTLLLALSSCSFSYVVKQGIFQLELLAGAEPIPIALRSKDLDAKKRAKLILIQDVRSFAKAELGLKAKNYQDVNLSWDRALFTVSAAEALKFEPYRWWFPIIGYVPYKGFFDKDDAIFERNRLVTLGFDTQVGRVDGYSTLGYFLDPVWPSMLNLSDQALVDLIIHELTHETIYVANQTIFNETLASFVAKVGTKMYMEKRFGIKSAEYQKVVDYQRDHQTYQDFFYDLYGRLDKAYGLNQTLAEKTKNKSAILLDAKHRYQKLSIGEDFQQLDWSRINNAYLMSFKSYNFDDPVFLELLELSKNFKHFISELSYYSQSHDPFKSLRERVLKLKGPKDEKA
jgi:predicted aminopeptidase